METFERDKYSGCCYQPLRKKSVHQQPILKLTESHTSGTVPFHLNKDFPGQAIIPGFSCFAFR
jgi:hypothetical protein